MKIKSLVLQILTMFLALLMAVPPGIFAQDASGNPIFKQEELDQILAPIALYPDALLTQVLMASTYPLDVVNADRWAKKNKDKKGDAFAKALEAQPWDPSVKSLVNFPQVLTMMSEKLDWTQKLGDAFLAQQKDVMDSIQKLRAQAQASGNLKTTKEQVVKVEKQVIIIESASPQVIYVPAYNPTVVYGVWAYPAYPPYPVYPPGYVATTAAFSFAAGVAVGAAWGYAWGQANWNGGSVNVNYNQNVNINNNINRAQYQQSASKKYNQMSPSQQVQARQAYRGYTGSALTPKEQQQAQQRAQQAQQQQTGQQAKQAQQQQTGQQAKQAQQQQTGQQAKQAQQQQTGQQAKQAQQQQTGQQAKQAQQQKAQPAQLSGQKSPGGKGTSQVGSSGRGGAFEGMDRGSSAKASSARGSGSRESMSRGSGGSGGGGSRGGGRR